MSISLLNSDNLSNELIIYILVDNNSVSNSIFLSSILLIFLSNSELAILLRLLSIKHIVIILHNLFVLYNFKS